MDRVAIAKKLDVSVSTVNKYLDGTRKPKWETVEKLKPVTGKSFDWWRRATLSQIKAMFEKLCSAGQS